MVAVGWDVGGWHGTGNAVVVLRWDGRRVERLGADVVDHVGRGACKGPGTGHFAEAELSWLSFFTGFAYLTGGACLVLSAVSALAPARGSGRR